MAPTRRPTRAETKRAELRKELRNQLAARKDPKLQGTSAFTGQGHQEEWEQQYERDLAVDIADLDAATRLSDHEQRIAVFNVEARRAARDKLYKELFAAIDLRAKDSRRKVSADIKAEWDAEHVAKLDAIRSRLEAVALSAEVTDRRLGAEYLLDLDINDFWTDVFGHDAREIAIGNLDVAAEIHRRFEEKITKTTKAPTSSTVAPTAPDTAPTTPAAPVPAPSGSAAVSSGLRTAAPALAKVYDSNDVDKDGKVTDAEIKTMAARKYPQLSFLVNSPRWANVGAVILEATRKGWGPAELDGALAQRAPEWIALSDTAQAWEAIKANPALKATVEQRKAAQARKISAHASSLGVTLDPASLDALVESAIKFNWDDSTLTGELVDRYGQGAYAGTGTIAATTDTLRRLAGSYLLPVDDAALQEWSGKITAGTATTDGYESHLRELARSRFPWLSDQIDQGIAPSTYFGFHRAAIAKTLDLSPDEVDFNDSRFAPVIDFVDEKGIRRSRTLSEAQQWARDRPEYDRTSEYREKSASFALALMKDFGEIA